MVLDTDHHQDDREPAREVDDVEVEENLQGQVGHELVAELDGRGLHGVRPPPTEPRGDADPGEHGLRDADKCVVCRAGHLATTSGSCGVITNNY